ncbi:MAG: prolyl aminopeptidase [Myxococcales bacterium]|nr:prolyl aminopeptidase [Myxococcales bacterium]
MRTLYPECEPYDSGHLSVSGVHQVYWERSGNPKGVPVIFVHGGPGGGCSPWNRRLFDPAHWNVTLFDQRGCGRSTPHASLHENTTPDLIADMERLRRHLDVHKWLVFGGSWGSTLGLAYAQSYPERTLGLILRGVFLAGQDELDWFYGGGAGRVFPEAWAKFRGHVRPDERDDLLNAYYKRLRSSDPEIMVDAARAWTRWEMSCSRLIPGHREVDDALALSLARIETHFFVHDAWLEPNQLISGVDKIAHLPCTIVQGRYDMVCPPISAWRIAERWPKAKLQIVGQAGHSSLESGILSGLLNATDAMRDENF